MNNGVNTGVTRTLIILTIAMMMRPPFVDLIIFISVLFVSKASFRTSLKFIIIVLVDDHVKLRKLKYDNYA